MEITIKEQNYRIAKLSVFDQLKVARKLLPVLAGVVSEFRSGGAMDDVLPKIADAISGLSDEDCNAIIYPCLAVVSRQHMKSWTPVFAGGTLAFDDIDLMIMLQLVARVVADSLGNFLQELPTAETLPQPAA